MVKIIHQKNDNDGKMPKSMVMFMEADTALNYIICKAFPLQAVLFLLP